MLLLSGGLMLVSITINTEILSCMFATVYKAKTECVARASLVISLITQLSQTRSHSYDKQDWMKMLMWTSTCAHILSWAALVISCENIFINKPH